MRTYNCTLIVTRQESPRKAEKVSFKAFSEDHKQAFEFALEQARLLDMVVYGSSIMPDLEASAGRVVE